MFFKVTTFIISLGLLVTVTHLSSGPVTDNSDRNTVSSPIIQNSSQTNYSSMPDSIVVSSPETDTGIDAPPIPRETIKIYLNPSVQVHNSYVNGLGTEAENMRDIAALMYQKLATIYYIDVEGNLDRNGLSLSKSVALSNSVQRHIHFALHSNAGGGSGTEIYTKGDRSFATAMYEGFLELGDFKRRGIKDGNHLYEIKSSKAHHVALIELAFHDNVKEATFIVENKEAIAAKLVQSILKFIDKAYPAD